LYSVFQEIVRRRQMKITKVEEQGIRLIITLARNGEQMTLPELAKAEQLSEALVAKVMGQLRKGGLVDAFRGRSGGYELRQSPDKITVTAVLRALGKAPLQACYNNGYEGTDGDPCPHVSDCGLRPVWEYVGEKITEALDSITISDIIQKERSVRTVMNKLRG
jgi:Rrf2 family transcriptional regulator, nitric oxide-sensitive transcriptional repressor